MKKNVNPFYLSKAWKMKRQKILQRDNYLCQAASRKGMTKAAEVVHHIYPLEDYPELRLVDWNLISLSHAEHNRCHDRNTNKVIGYGKQLQNKFRREFKKFYLTPPP